MLALQLVLDWGSLNNSSQLWRNPVKSIISQNPQEPSSAALELLVKLIGRVGDWSRQHSWKSNQTHTGQPVLPRLQATGLQDGYPEGSAVPKKTEKV